MCDSLIPNKKDLAVNHELTGFLTLSIIAGISYGILQFIIPLYASSIKISDSEIGFICGLAQIGGLTMNLPAGFLIDRLGAGKMIIIGSLINVLILFAVPLATIPILLIVFLFLEGASRTIGMIALNSAFINRLDSFGYSKSGWLRAVMSIGMNLAGPLISGYMIGRVEYSIIFFVIAFFTFLPVPALVIYRKKIKIKSPFKLPRRQPGINRNTIEKPGISKQLKELIHNKRLIKVAVFQSLVIAGITSFPTFILLLVVNKLNYSPSAASLMLTFQGIGFIIMMFCGGKLIQKIELDYLYISGFTVKVAGLVLVGFFKSFVVIWTGTLFFGLGTALLTSMSYTLLAKIDGDKGLVSGFYYLFMGTAGVLAPMYCGLLVSLFGIESAFAGFIPLDLIVLIYFLTNLLSQSKKNKK